MGTIVHIGAVPRLPVVDCGEVGVLADFDQVAWPTYPTLESVFGAYVREHCKSHTSDYRRPAQASRYWFEAFGPQRDARTLKRADGRELVSLLESKGLKAGSIRRVVGVGVAALNHAKKEERLTVVPKFQVPGVAMARQRVFTLDEQAKLMALPKPRRIQLFLHIAFATGARSRAIEELQWDRCNLETRTIDFRVPGVVYRNKRRAVVPINDALLRRLSAAKVYLDAHTPDDPYVIGVGPSGRPTTSYHLVRALVSSLGIDERGVCRHTIRHTVATRLLEAGVPIHKVAQLLGDRVSMVEANYAHVRPVALLDCANAL